MEPRYSFCLHAHYHQPPRGNPFRDGEVVERDAAPFADWNERVTAECYAPNAKLGNFENLSFDIGELLAAWLEEHAPETYGRIFTADAGREGGRANAIAQGMDHSILPLDTTADKVTQVKWGMAAFEARFGRTPEGFWLTEMAADYETLEVLSAQGIAWTILTESQIEGGDAGAGLYWIPLPNGERIKVFVRDEQLSNNIAFNLGDFGGAGRWAHEVLVPRKRWAGPLTLIVTNGETFGHHWGGEEQFLHWLLTYEAQSAGYTVTTLNRYAAEHEPTREVTLKENMAWNCPHGLARWSTGCACTPGDSGWKGTLWRAFDGLREQIDGLYVDFVKRAGDVDAFALRDAYVGVMLGQVAAEDFLPAQGIQVDDAARDSLLKLLEAQVYRLRAMNSSTFFFPQLDAHTTVYGIANAAYALHLTEQATGVTLSGDFRRALDDCRQTGGIDGADIRASQIYDQIRDGADA